MLLKTGNHLKDSQKKQIQTYGITVDIKEFTGTTDCPDCVYDTQLRSSSNPNCITCGGTGKINAYTSHNEKVLPHWFTDEELAEVPVGGITVGDCRILAEYLTLDYWRNAIANKTVLSVSGIDMVCKRVLPTIINTAVHAYCSRTT